MVLQHVYDSANDSIFTDELLDQRQEAVDGIWQWADVRAYHP